MKLFKNFSTKLCLANLLIIVISVFATSSYFYHFLKQKEEQQFTQTLTTLTTKLSEQTDTLIDNMDKISLQIASTPYITNHFTNIPHTKDLNHFSEDHFLRSEMRDFLNSYTFKNNIATRICLYDQYGNFVDAGYKLTDSSATSDFFTSERFNATVDFFETNNNRYLFIPPHYDPFSSAPMYGEKMIILSLIRPIKNYTIVGSNVVGYVEVQLEYSALDDLFTSLGTNTNFAITDNTGQVIYPFVTPLYYLKPTDLNNPKHLVVAEPLKSVPYHVILMQDKDLLLSSYKRLQEMLIFIFLVILLISGISQIILIAHFTRPLNKLKASVETINLDNLSLNLVDEAIGDEFTQLNQAFTRMFDHLNISIQHTILAETSALHSHLLALQAQINPHFIHNVLSVMSVLAEENDVPKIENMCNKLSGMLRYSSSYTDIHTSLEAELDYASSYLELMQERYEDKFTFTINLSDTARHVAIPKLIIQPLTENCFHHGFSQKPAPWYIEINCYTKDKFWFVDIIDNGIGFTDSFLKKFNQYAAQVDLEQHPDECLKLEIGGLSLNNIYLRLYILYKESLIFRLANQPLGGSIITLGGKIYHD
ncbi:MAG: sensor histidine kinase [Cellulosilyticaceae bacterium]